MCQLLFTTSQLCDELHTSRDTLRMLREEGALPAYDMGGSAGFTYYEVDVRQFLERFRGKRFTSREVVREVMSRCE